MDAEIEKIERKLTIFESFVAHGTVLKAKGSPSEVCGSVDSLIARANELRKENDEYLRTQNKPLEFEFIATDHNALQNAGNIIGKLSGIDSLLTYYEKQLREFFENQEFLKI